VAGVVHIPWYATGFRGDELADGLAEIAAVALRYGARSYSVYRYRDDRYKFLQTAEFESKVDWERYWMGPEFIDFRAMHSSYYQVPVVYGWTDLVTAGALPPEAVGAAAGPDEAGEARGDLAG
jgi:hypothetical protein